jgi:plasmid maintenance system killer protein
MIRGFRAQTTKAVFSGESPKGFPSDLVKVARRKLGYLDAAVDLRDLRLPPATGWKRWAATASDNIRSGSTTSFEFASGGRPKDRPTSK